MYYNYETLEEMSEGHVSQHDVNGKNKDPSEGESGHKHSYECIHEQKGPYINLKINWCKSCGAVIKYYVDGDGHQVTLKEYNVNVKGE